jgi:hypothetical protein
MKKLNYKINGIVYKMIKDYGVVCTLERVEKMPERIFDKEKNHFIYSFKNRLVINKDKLKNKVIL